MKPFGIALFTLLVFSLWSRADEKFHIGFGCSPVKAANCEGCALKAVKFLADKEKFLFAEIEDNGSVRGWSDKASVIVLPFLRPVGPHVLTLTASRDLAEAERLRKELFAYLLEGP